MWRGPDPKELADLTYCEATVINLAKVDVSDKRVFLGRSGYAPTGQRESPLYHQRNVVVYPQDPDAALRALVGMGPESLSRMLHVQFVGDNRAALRSHPDLQVSVRRLRAAFQWLSLNPWPFMEATKEHSIWETGILDSNLESLLEEYAKSVGSTEGGFHLKPCRAQHA